MRPDSRAVEVSGLSFHCLTAGDPERPLLLFLHGFPEYSGAWAELIERLSDDWFCVAPDQRGYGRSSKPEGVESYSGGKLARDAAGILTAFAPRAAAAVGHDWGASVAYALAFARPDLIERLIILNGVHPIPFQRALAAGGAQSEASAYIDKLRAPEAEARLSADGFRRLIRLFGADMGMGMGWFDAARRAEYVAAWSAPGALSAMLNWYRASPLRIARPGAPLAVAETPRWDPAKMRVTMPHLVIWGMGDRALLPEARAGLGDLCDDLTVIEIEGADHWLHHQKPEEVAAAVRAFLARGEGAL